MIVSKHLSYQMKPSSGFTPFTTFPIAIELGVFGKLGDQRLTARPVARELPTNELATEILRNVPAAMVGVGKNGGFYFKALKAGEVHHRGNACP